MERMNVTVLSDWKKNKYRIYIVITKDFDERATGARLPFHYAKIV
ncbi:hypothetical protein [Bacillus sp. FSL R9-9492]